MRGMGEGGKSEENECRNREVEQKEALGRDSSICVKRKDAIPSAVENPGEGGRE